MFHNNQNSNEEMPKQVNRKRKFTVGIEFYFKITLVIVSTVDSVSIIAFSCGQEVFFLIIDNRFIFSFFVVQEIVLSEIDWF